MENTREQKLEKFTEVMTIIALRKTEFFNKTWILLEEKIPDDFAEHQDEELKDAILRIISAMDNTLFLSPEELKSKRVNSTSSIEDLKINKEKLQEEFYRSLKEQYPDLLL